MKKRLISALLILVLLLSFTQYTIAESDSEQMIVEEYSGLKDFYYDVKTIFPEAPIGNLPSFEEYYYNRVNNKHIPSLNVSEEFEKKIGDEMHHLKIYDDGSFEMISLLGDSIFTGIVDIVEGNPKQLRWRYSSVTAYHQININLNIYYNYLSEQYFFGVPNVASDISHLMNIAIISLYREGSDDNIITFHGNVIHYDYYLNDFDNYFGINLSVTLDYDNGTISNYSQTPGPLY